MMPTSMLVLKTESRAKAFDLLRKIIRCAVNGQHMGTTGMSLSYQPTCSIDALKARAKLYTQIRQFLLNVMSWKSKHQSFHRQVSPMYI